MRSNQSPSRTSRERCSKCGTEYLAKHRSRHASRCDRILARLSDEERFWSKVDKSGTCWLWLGGINQDGYGVFTTKTNNRGKTYVAHRVAYALAHGREPEQVIDHICRTRACVNPDHLRDVSNAENVLSGIGPTAINARKEKCSRGHQFDQVDKRGWRSCSRCRAIARKARRGRDRAALPVEGETP